MQFAPWIRSRPPRSVGASRFWRVHGIARRIYKILSSRICPIRTTPVSLRILRTTGGTVCSLFRNLCRPCCYPSAILQIDDMRCKSLFPRPIRKDHRSVSWRCPKATHFSGVRWIRFVPFTPRLFLFSRNTTTYGRFWWTSTRTVWCSIRRIPRSVRIIVACFWVYRFWIFHS